MSNSLAIAGVTAVLREVLGEGMINQNVSGILGSTVTILARHTLLRREEPLLGRELTAIFRAEGIEVRENAAVRRVAHDGRQFRPLPPHALRLSTVSGTTINLRPHLQSRA